MGLGKTLMLGYAIAATVVSVGAASPAGAQSRSAVAAPDECFGFTFGPWRPTLRSMASTWTPGTDPVRVTGRPDTLRENAARVPTLRRSAGADSASDSLLVLYPTWWPAGVSIEWTGSRADTLVGVAHAFVADGRLESPASEVRGLRVPCRRPDS